MTGVAGVLRRIAAAVLSAGLLAGSLPPAAAAVPEGAQLPPGLIDPSRGTPGFCPTEEGVTVVIDFQDLGGTTIVRCAPGPVVRGFTGHSALLDAGITLQGTRRWGEAFICRLEGRPGPAEALAVTGRHGYREPCIDTPPAAAYWSYWHAPNGGQWQYSQWGVKNRSAIRGGFEGWSFSLNATAQTNPRPRIAPVRPDDRPPATVPRTPAPSRPDDPGISEGPPDDTSTTRPSGDPTSTTGRPGPTGQTGPGGIHRPRTSTGTLAPGLPRGPGTNGDPLTPGPADTPVEDPAWTGGESVAAGARTAPAPKGVPAGTVVAVLAVLVLMGAAALTATHRRRSSPRADRAR